MGKRGPPLSACHAPHPCSPGWSRQESGAGGWVGVGFKPGPELLPAGPAPPSVLSFSFHKAEVLRSQDPRLLRACRTRSNSGAAWPGAFLRGPTALIRGCPALGGPLSDEGLSLPPLPPLPAPLLVPAPLLLSPLPASQHTPSLLCSRGACPHPAGVPQLPGPPPPCPLPPHLPGASGTAPSCNSPWKWGLWQEDTDTEVAGQAGVWAEEVPADAPAVTPRGSSPD